MNQAPFPSMSQSQAPNFTNSQSLPEITQPVQTSSNPKLTKILVGLIPIFTFAVTGIISYSIINNKNNETLRYQSSASSIGKRTEKTTKAKMLIEASVSGCIFSTRFDEASGAASLKEQKKAEIEKIKINLKQEKGEIVLAKIKKDSSPNFCFKHTREVNEKLGIFFYQLNPDFQTLFLNTFDGSVSNPFLIFKSAPGGAIDYGWMVIKK